MKHIFPAIKKRWDANAALKKLGGTLHLADDSQSARPNTSVHGQFSEQMDTFGSDIERWSIEFRLHGRGSVSQDAMDWFEAMRGTFHRSILKSSAGAYVSMTVDASNAEEIDDGTCDSNISFVCYFQRTAQMPMAGIS